MGRQSRAKTVQDKTAEYNSSEVGAGVAEAKAV